MRVLAFTRYGPQAASTRQRLLQYIPHLSSAGIEVDYHCLLPDDYVQSLVRGEPYPRWRIAGHYARRMRQLFRPDYYDVMWVYSDLFPYFPAFLERFFSSRQRPIVYDLDDAFFHQYDDSASPLVRGFLGGKFASLLDRASACCCGNGYLREYAARYCSNSVVIPTVVDTAVYKPLAQKPGKGPVVIGWIGSPTTWPNVRPLLPLLQHLCAEQDVCVRVVGAGPAAERDRFPGLELVEWNEATEVAEVQRMDIGIMPLFDGPFERGKSGYKLIQYMACGLPVVASPVGVNREIVIESENGFLATDELEWRDALTRLISDPAMRFRLGSVGRSIAEAKFSVASQAPRLVEILKLAAMGDLAPSAHATAASAQGIR